jgi:hypothetical protein
VRPDPLSLIALPMRVALGAARAGLSVAEHAVDRLLGRGGDGEEHEQSARAAPASPSRRRFQRGRPQAAPAAPFPSRAPVPAHVSEEPDLVAGVADPGAEDGAGADVTVGEPWDGYARMRADDVVERIVAATREELAMVQLYEGSHRRRKTVLAAAERRLKELSPPRAGRSDDDRR